MRPRDRGSIVNVGSALAFIGIPLQSAYCSSKFACRGFFESTRAELLHEGSHVRMSMVHLPAVNTPQFDWCQTSLDRQPQPVPPIYQPEVPARYILEVALDGRRAKVVGSWNKILVAAGSVFPGLGNQYAAIGAWDSQLTSEPLQPDRAVNLYEPVDADIRRRCPRQLRRQGRRLHGPELPEVTSPYGPAVHESAGSNHRREAPASAISSTAELMARRGHPPQSAALADLAQRSDQG